ncbi:MAG: hypothetical protein ISN29_02965 [Gammaproteobacteria bacterium AqS3]|nr:hypothetical protein [Gammaproteobacteria bacterium AqS3]
MTVYYSVRGPAGDHLKSFSTLAKATMHKYMLESGGGWGLTITRDIGTF